jgi:hypothetical protein
MGLNEIFKKIAEIENKQMQLGKHEVDLGVMEDLTKALADMQGIVKGSNDELTKLDNADTAIAKAKVEAQKLIDLANSNADKAYNNSKKIAATYSKNLMKYADVLSRVEKQAKDLGIDAKQIPNYNAVSAIYDTANAAINKFSNFVFKN